MNCQNERGTNHRRSLYKTGGRQRNVSGRDEDGDPESYFQYQALSDQTVAVLENPLEARDSREISDT